MAPGEYLWGWGRELNIFFRGRNAHQELNRLLTSSALFLGGSNLLECENVKHKRLIAQ